MVFIHCIQSKCTDLKWSSSFEFWNLILIIYVIKNCYDYENKLYYDTFILVH